MDNTQITQASPNTAQDTCDTDALGTLSEDTGLSDSPDTDDQVQQLRREIEALKKTIADTEENNRRLGAQLGEFAECFPDTDVRSIPEAVWESVKSGNSLAAAYALHQAKARHATGTAVREGVGSVRGSHKEYFTPDEVRAMSQIEVRANYKKIISSMKTWNR